LLNLNLNDVIVQLFKRDARTTYDKFPYRCKNLKDHLVRSKLSKEKDAVGGMFKCGSRKCKVCDNVLVGSSFEGRKFHINHHFDCNSEGVVYLVTCKACKIQYVGCTLTLFRLRFNNHKSQKLSK
jgi:hypothetical protein